MPNFERHVFVCTNVRPDGHPRGCCAGKQSEAIREALKQAVAERGLKRRVRINGAGCLDQCEHGPTIVVYPEAVWYGFVTLGRCARNRRIPPRPRQARRATPASRRVCEYAEVRTQREELRDGAMCHECKDNLRLLLDCGERQVEAGRGQLGREAVSEE